MAVLKYHKVLDQLKLGWPELAVNQFEQLCSQKGAVNKRGEIEDTVLSEIADQVRKDQHLSPPQNDDVS